MATESNIRTLHPLPPPGAHRCAMCGSRVDVVLCSFAFERVHRRVPLCRGHRRPLLEIDHFTRPDLDENEDVPPAWLANPASSPSEAALLRGRQRLTQRRSRRIVDRGSSTGQVLLMPVR